MKLDLTLGELNAMKPCSERFRAMRPMFGPFGRKRVTIRQAVEGGASLSDLLWVAGKLAATDNRMLGLVVQFGLDCTMSCHTTSPQPEYLVQVVSAVSAVVAALLSNRKPNHTEIQAARSAGWSELAAESAARSARSAGWSELAARSAARSAAESAARSAGWSESAARSAAESAGWSELAARSAAESAGWSESAQLQALVKLFYKHADGPAEVKTKG